MDPRPPTAEEINVFDSLDERWALKNFLGKDLEQAQALFRENSLHYLDDLMHMGPVAFRFYVPAAIAYLLSQDAAYDESGVSSFCGIIEFRLDHHPASIAPVASILREGILGILKDCDRYVDHILYYDDLTGRCRALLSRLGP